MQINDLNTDLKVSNKESMHIEVIFVFKWVIYHLWTIYCSSLLIILAI